MHNPHPVLAVFASDKGPGDPERSSIMSQAGLYFARKGARILALSEQGILPVPLITSARAAGGEVSVIGEQDASLPAALTEVPLERIADRPARLRRVAELADAVVGLPGSLASASDLYGTWVAARRLGGKPVILLNRNRAFEVLRGFAADVLSHDVPHSERFVQFADSVEDVWTRVTRVLSAAPSR